MKRDRFRHIEAPRPSREPTRPAGAAGPTPTRPSGNPAPPVSGRFAAVEAPASPPPPRAPLTPLVLPEQPPSAPGPNRSPSAAGHPGELTAPETLPPDHPGLGAPDRSLFAMLERDTPEVRPSSGPLSDALFAPPGTGAAASATQARFNPAPPPVALDERDEDTLPFRRCADCGVDSNRFATRCGHCDADLTTPNQLAFQRQIAQEVRERQAREAEQAEAFRQEAEARSQSLTAARRAYHEQLAAQQRRTIENDLESRGFASGFHGSIGDWLLMKLPARFQRGAKWGVVGVAILLFIVSFGLPLSARLGVFRLGGVLRMVAALMLFVFVPGSWLEVLFGGRHSRRRWW